MYEYLYSVRIIINHSDSALNTLLQRKVKILMNKLKCQERAKSGQSKTSNRATSGINVFANGNNSHF